MDFTCFATAALSTACVPSAEQEDWALLEPATATATGAINKVGLSATAPAMAMTFFTGAVRTSNGGTENLVPGTRLGMPH